MNLLLDIGNTRVKWRLVNNKGVVVQASAFQPSLHNGADIDAFLVQLKPYAVSRVWVAEVANVLHEFQLLERLRLLFPELQYRKVESEAECLGVYNSYAEPQRLGVDRWLSAVEAWHLSGGVPVAVFDFGTAAKLDVVADGRHQGGHIVPGLSMMRQALMENTSKVRFEAEDTYQQGWGCSTAAAVENGTWVMLMAWLERELQAFNTTYPEGVAYLLGGDVAHFSQSTVVSAMKGQIVVANNLVLDALWRLVRND